MGAHNDMDKMFEGETSIKDPGDAGVIVLKRWGGVCEVKTEAAETRTLQAPLKAGVLGAISLRTDGGDLTLTVTGGFNPAGDTSMTFSDAGDFAIFYSVNVDGTFTWKLISSSGLDSATAAKYFPQDTIEVIADGDTAITAAEVMVGLMQMTSSTGGRAPTVPTGTAMNAVVPIGFAIDWHFINLGNQTVTMSVATGHTIVGLATMATLTQGHFRTLVSAANTAITYRVA